MNLYDLRLTILIWDATIWPSRPLVFLKKAMTLLISPKAVELWKTQLIVWGVLSIDEAVGLIQSVCAGNSNTMGFIMFPQYHSSTTKNVVIQNRRLLEDKIVAVLDTYEISVNFLDSGHGGDKRKKSQQCHWQEIIM